MMPRSLGSNMNAGTPCCAVYPVVCFDDSHTYTVFLIKLRVCMYPSLALNISSVSFILWTDVLEKDYMCYHTQGQVIEFLFRHIHYRMVQLPDAAGCISSWWWNESFLTMTSPWRFAVPPGNICPVRPGQTPLSPPFWNKLQHKSCPPHSSWIPSRSLLYLTHPMSKFELCLLQFNHGQEMLSKISTWSVRIIKVKMTSASAPHGRLTCSIWSLQFWGTTSSFAWGGQRQLWV